MPLSTMSDGRILQIFRDGRRQDELAKRIQLPDGAQGNLETLAHMSRIVREDAALLDLRSFALRDIIGRQYTSVDDRITRAFEHCRDEIAYRDEGDDTETVADLWSCEFGLDPDRAVGDCAVKSVALATLIVLSSSLTVKPIFVAIRQVAGVDWFNHVYVGIPRGTGVYEALDPTPPNFVRGQELGSLSRIQYPIFR